MVKPFMTAKPRVSKSAEARAATSVGRVTRATIALLCCLVLGHATTSAAVEPAPTPPMGWNSWDAFGLTINETDFKANAEQLAQLRSYGWRYAVIDEGWYMGNPFGDKLQNRQYVLDEHGLLAPATARFPSAADGRGFEQLGRWVHARGLKFGLHIVRGIPKDAVSRNTPIANSSFHATDAADTSDTCGWDDGNYGVRDNAAGQAYYDSMLALYARWGLDFIKVDCIADHPYKPSEIRQIASAIAKSGRPIVLSLSPGPTQPTHAAEIRQYAQMWRMTNDVWDGWTFPHSNTEDAFPMGVRNIFDYLPNWIGQAADGRWPDADMLPLGSLTPNPGWGKPRQSRLTPDEQRTELTLLAIVRSPLILGANLTKLDEDTRKLITNKEVIAVNQNSHDNHPVDHLPQGFMNVRVWVAAGSQQSQHHMRYLALFNLDEHPVTVEAAWDQLGLDPGMHVARDLWQGHTLPAAERLKVQLPPHASALYAIEVARN
jgi:alpha-galactosidase